MEERKIFDTKEIANYLNCSVSSIRALVRNKAIPNFRIGAKLNFNKESIDKWIESQEIENGISIKEDNNVRSIK